jgi:hypothetical protein
LTAAIESPGVFQRYHTIIFKILTKIKRHMKNQKNKSVAQSHEKSRKYSGEALTLYLLLRDFKSTVLKNKPREPKETIMN